MPRHDREKIRVRLNTDLKTIALVHKLMVTGLYHTKLSQQDFDNVRRGQEMFEHVLLGLDYYSESELRMVLDSTAKIITVAP